MSEEVLDAVIVGAWVSGKLGGKKADGVSRWWCSGFSGMYELHRLRDMQGLKVKCFESSEDAGGTWNWNRYPGARVDVRSAEYSYSFDKSLEQEWTWKEVYAPQPELLTYVHHVLDRYDLRRSIDFNARVKSCVWDDAKMVWKVTVLHHAEMERSIDDILGTAEPEAHEESVQARFLIFATGCLSAPNLPKWPGFETSSAKIYHTARWPTQGVDFTGLKVAIIGTGSSSVQTISTIAPECAELTVFQRTATYSIPAHNRKLTPEEVEKDKAQYEGLRKRQQEKTGCIDWVVPTRSVDEFTEEEIEEELERRWQTGGLTFGAAFKDGMTNPKANEKLKLFIHKKIRSIVKDPVTAELLCPDQVVSCKRLCIDTGYYPTYNLPHVKLVSVKANPIKDVGGPKGTILLQDGTEYGPFDAIISATGFDAMTGALSKIDIRGKNGESLKEKWAAGPLTMLGLMVDGFPNAFMVSGPGSPSVLTNMIPSLEQMVEYISDIIAYMRKEGIKIIEPTSEAVMKWVLHVNEEANKTLYPTGCNSWYLGSNVPGKVRVFLPYTGGYPRYKEICDKEMADGFPSFILTK